MIIVSYTAWGKTFNQEFDPGCYPQAFRYAEKLLKDGYVVTIRPA